MGRREEIMWVKDKYWRFNRYNLEEGYGGDKKEVDIKYLIFFNWCFN